MCVRVSVCVRVCACAYVSIYVLVSLCVCVLCVPVCVCARVFTCVPARTNIKACCFHLRSLCKFDPLHLISRIPGQETEINVLSVRVADVRCPRPRLWPGGHGAQPAANKELWVSGWRPLLDHQLVRVGPILWQLMEGCMRKMFPRPMFC